MNDSIKIGADINAGDGGYSEGTQEKYDEFAKGRNQSLGKMRIRELVRESHLDVYGLGKDREKWECTVEKFAQLIVAECVNNIKVWELDSRNHISYMLERHFGVEE